MPASQPKSQQLQIRVSAAQKQAIRRSAERAGMSMSDWVLSRLVPPVRDEFQALLAALAASDEPGTEFAEILDFLAPLGAREFENAVAEPPRVALDAYWSSYVAATVEHAAGLKLAPVPAWTADVPPLERPAFASNLTSLRLHLLAHSPPAFAQRNIFIDASVGDRV